MACVLKLDGVVKFSSWTGIDALDEVERGKLSEDDKLSACSLGREYLKVGGKNNLIEFKEDIF